MVQHKNIFRGAKSSQCKTNIIFMDVNESRVGKLKGKQTK